MGNETLIAEQDTSGSAKFVLHRPCLTPTERASRDHRKRLLANIEERAREKAAKAARPPIVEIVPAQPLAVECDTTSVDYIHKRVRELEHEIDRLQRLLPGGRQAPPLGLIFETVADDRGISVAQMCSKIRTAQVVRARQMAIYLARMLTKVSTPFIARKFGQCDHTSVLHACRRVEWLVSHDHVLMSDIDRLKEKIQALNIARLAIVAPTIIAVA